MPLTVLALMRNSACDGTIVKVTWAPGLCWETATRKTEVPGGLFSVTFTSYEDLNEKQSQANKRKLHLTRRSLITTF